MNPVRLQRTSRPGFNMQALSRATNDLPALYVGRGSVYGNRFVVGQPVDDAEWLLMSPADVHAYREGVVPNAAEAVRLFTLYQLPNFSLPQLAALSGHNLFCWCAPDAPCHADPLLERVSLRLSQGWLNKRAGIRLAQPPAPEFEYQQERPLGASVPGED